MRLPALGLVALVIVVPASASTVDPAALVLSPIDVPTGFVVDRRQSRETSNDTYSSPPSLPKLVVRAERITGYRRVFRHRASKVKVIHSQVDLFRRPQGAHAFLVWVDVAQRQINAARGVINAYGRDTAGLGEESWVYWSGYPGYYVLVVWRHGRSLGVLSTWELGREGTMRLARAQQRRIAAALR
jgi:hypothetical protein